MPGITPKMLTQQLRDLEENGLVHREVYAVIPPKVEYSLTEDGKTFLPVLQAMYKWGRSYADQFDITIDTSLQEKIIKQELIAVKK
jgi:DNA-binding HxlR family transcriptional regulator